MNRSTSKMRWWALAVVVALILGYQLLTRPGKNANVPGVDENPTVSPASTVVNANGVSMEVIAAHTEATNYRVEVCYTLPDTRDWLLASPSVTASTFLVLPDRNVAPSEEGTMYWRTDSDGKVLQRCQYLLFFVMLPSLEGSLSLSVESISARKAGQPDHCVEIRDKMGERGDQLTMDCLTVDGIEGPVYVRAPLDQLRNDPFFKYILQDVKEDYHSGPWSFTFPVNPD